MISTECRFMRSSLPCLGISFLAASTLSVASSLNLSAQAAPITIPLPEGGTAEIFPCERVSQVDQRNWLCYFESGPSPYDYYRGEVRSGRLPGGAGKFLYPHGRGIFVYQDDSRYEGPVRNGQPNTNINNVNETGMFLFANGDRYVGGFRNGTFHGRGVMTFADGRRYEGGFRNGSFNDIKLGNTTYRGKFTYPTGDSYVGGVRNGQPHGDGVYKFGGNTFKGPFRQGQVNGTGELVTNEGVRCKGLFFSSRLSSNNATCTFPRGNEFRSYIGELRGGRPEGKGTLVYANGRRFAGQFRNGQPVTP